MQYHHGKVNKTIAYDHSLIKGCSAIGSNKTHNPHYIQLFHFRIKLIALKSFLDLL